MRFDRFRAGRRAVGLGALALTLVLATAGSAAAQTGGSPAPGGTGSSSGAGRPGLATLNSDGTAIPPTDAPRAVRKAINAANKIHTKPYRWGGGHGRWKDGGYDCSGAVSYVLHAAGLLKRPLDSGAFARGWGAAGAGQWITVYANGGHAYAVIAGLRWDTSAVGESLSSGSGPRWRSTQRSPSGYAAKYAPGY